MSGYQKPGRNGYKCPDCESVHNWRETKMSHVDTNRPWLLSWCSECGSVMRKIGDVPTEIIMSTDRRTDIE